MADIRRFRPPVRTPVARRGGARAVVPVAVPRDKITPRTPSPLLTGLVSYWKLDEASGTRADSHGTNHLTPTNAPVGAAGKLGQACDFESTSAQYLSHPDPTPLGDEDLTYALWFKRESLGVEQFLIGKDDDSSRRYLVGFDGADSLFFWPFMTGGTVSWVPAIADTNWHFVLIWRDTTALRIFIQVDNAAPQSVASTSWTPQAVATELRIGAREYPGLEGYFDGLIDDVALWRRVLTADERTALWNGGAGLAYPFGAEHPEDILLTDDDRDVFLPHVIQIEGTTLPFRVRVEPQYYFEHVTENAGLWVYAPTR